MPPTAAPAGVDPSALAKIAQGQGKAMLDTLPPEKQAIAVQAISDPQILQVILVLFSDGAEAMGGFGGQGQGAPAGPPPSGGVDRQLFG